MAPWGLSGQCLRRQVYMPCGTIYCTLSLPTPSLGKYECNRWHHKACIPDALVSKSSIGYTALWRHFLHSWLGYSMPGWVGLAGQAKSAIDGAT